jgi:hypothetical protein
MSEHFYNIGSVKFLPVAHVQHSCIHIMSQKVPSPFSSRQPGKAQGAVEGADRLAPLEGVAVPTLGETLEEKRILPRCGCAPAGQAWWIRLARYQFDTGSGAWR